MENVQLLAVAGFVGCFILLLILFLVVVNKVEKYQKKIQERLACAFTYGEEVNTGKRKVYVSASLLVDDTGKPEKDICPGGYEVKVGGLAIGSSVPSKGYRAAVENARLKTDEFGHSYADAPVQLFVCPLHGAADIWEVTSVDEDCFTCRHPLMGDLTLVRPLGMVLEPFTQIKLLQYVQKASENYVLQYTIASL